MLGEVGDIYYHARGESQCDAFLSEKLRHKSNLICEKLKGVFAKELEELIFQEVE